MEDLRKNIPKFPQLRTLSFQNKSLFGSVYFRLSSLTFEPTFIIPFILQQAGPVKISPPVQLLGLLAGKGEGLYIFPPSEEKNVVEFLVEICRVLIQEMKKKVARNLLSSILKKPTQTPSPSNERGVR